MKPKPKQQVFFRNFPEVAESSPVASDLSRRKAGCDSYNRSDSLGGSLVCHGHVVVFRDIQTAAHDEIVDSSCNKNIIWSMLDHVP